MKTGKAWSGLLDSGNWPQHDQKPRSHGVTMVLDKGLGLSATRDMLELASDYIDLIKLSFGTSAFYPEHLLRQKIQLIRSYDVDVCPGGTFLEAAVWRQCLTAYLRQAEALGFSHVEVSDGTISMDQTTRATCMRQARAMGLGVISEVGKKNTCQQPEPWAMRQQVLADLAHGADFVIIEARESGKGVGVFDQDGHLKPDSLEELVSGISETDRILWEAPLKHQQVDLITRFGPNVNLGNIPPEDIIALEALRCGLRGDTLRMAITAGQQAEQSVAAPSDA